MARRLASLMKSMPGSGTTSGPGSIDGRAPRLSVMAVLTPRWVGAPQKGFPGTARRAKRLVVR